MRADWTGSGAFTSGSTAHPRGATRQASGCAATTSTTSAEPSHGCRWRNRGTGDLTTHGFRASFPASVSWRFGAALRCQRGGDDRLVRVHVGDGRDADARRLRSLLARAQPRLARRYFWHLHVSLSLCSCPCLCPCPCLPLPLVGVAPDQPRPFPIGRDRRGWTSRRVSIQGGLITQRSLVQIRPPLELCQFARVQLGPPNCSRWR